MSTRNPAVAGSFYPADAHELRGQIAELRESAGPVAEAERPLRAVIAPHAGYRYSGAIAAAAFAALADEAERFERVAVLGPSHHVSFMGLALPKADVAAFATPLGEVPLDGTVGKELDDLRAVVRANAPHIREHSIEVELPFLQEIVGALPLIPLSVGQASTADVAKVLERLDDGRTLFVLSTDLSHGLTGEDATRFDARTARAIEALDDGAIEDRSACGHVPLRGLLAWAKQRGFAAERLGLCHSGDVTGSNLRVVGYGAWRIH